MIAFLLQIPGFWVWTLLMVVLATLFVGGRRNGLLGLGIWMIAAVASGHLAISTTLLLIAAACSAAFLPRLRGFPAIAGHGVLVLFSIALAAHVVPGFANISILTNTHSGSASAPFSLYLNFDKPYVLVLLVLAWPRLCAIETPFRRPYVLAAVIIAAGLFPIAVIARVLAPELSLPNWTLVFLTANLLQTCLIEEAFFRGYLQRIAQDRVGPAGAVTLISLVFGVAHLAGGLTLVLFAGFLGLACGLAFLFSGRLWVAVVLHFSFNAVHLLFFTYPFAI